MTTALGEPAGVTIARRIKEVRNRRGWSQDDLAARIREVGGSMSRAVLYRIEEGGTRARRLSVEDLMVLAAALGVAPIYLLTDTRSDASRAFITARISMSPPQLRAWFTGRGSPPADESMSFYMSERPDDELEAIRQQWAAAAEMIPASAPVDPTDVPPRVVGRKPAVPLSDRRKGTR